MPASTIGKLSAASPRTWRSRNIEILAAQALAGRGWRVLRHDLRVGGVQIDLLARDPRGTLSIVEVKAMSALCRLHPRQIRRLMNAGTILAGREPIQLIFAQVSGAEVHLLPVDGLTR